MRYTKKINHYWDKLAEGGIYNKCGCLDDKFGVSWQIVPSMLGKLTNEPIEASKLMYAFIHLKKFDIEKLVNA